MSMNIKRVVLGGIAGGFVLNIMDYLSNGIIFADRMRAEANAFKPGLGDQAAAMDVGMIAGYIIMDFVLAMLLVYTYAAMRPRFGPGPKTAVITALVFWIFGSIVAIGYLNIGIMSAGLWWQFGIFWLVSLLVTSVVGGMIYKEDPA